MDGCDKIAIFSSEHVKSVKLNDSLIMKRIACSNKNSKFYFRAVIKSRKRMSDDSHITWLQINF